MADLLALLRGQGWSAALEEIPAVDESLPEAARVFACVRGRADRVRRARPAGAYH